MCRSVVEVKVGFLDTLPMVALRIAQTKEAFLEEVILLIPEGKRNVLEAMGVRDARNAVFAPSIRPRP